MESRYVPGGWSATPRVSGADRARFVDVLGVNEEDMTLDAKTSSVLDTVCLVSC
jgi:hypothetical protein